MAGFRIPQSVAQRRTLKAYLSSDHVSAATGKTIAIKISKNGGSFADPSGGATNATEIGNGWYYVDLSTTDTNTKGPLIVRGTAATIDDAEILHQVVDAHNADFDALPAIASGSAGAVVTAGTGTAQLSVSSGRANADVLYWNASAVATPDTAGYPKVTHKVGTGTGEINLSSGKVPATLASTDVTGNVACDLQTIKTQAVTCSAGVTVAAFVGNATAAIVVDATGHASINWGDVSNKTTTNALTGTTISTSQQVASVTGAVGSVTGAVGSISGVTFPTNFGVLGINSSGHVSRVTTVDAVTAISTGGIAAASFAAGAIDAAAIATDAIGSAELAASAVSEIAAAISGSDPWSTALPGAYGAGTAGYILGTNLNATISSRMATFSVPSNFSSLVINAAGVVSALPCDDTGTPLTGSGSINAVIVDYGAGMAPEDRLDGVPLTMDLTPTVTPRDLSAVTAPTIQDCLASAFIDCAGRETVVGTTYTKKSTNGAITVRTFTLNSGTNPTSRT